MARPRAEVTRAETKQTGQNRPHSSTNRYNPTDSACAGVSTGRPRQIEAHRPSPSPASRMRAGGPAPNHSPSRTPRRLPVQCVAV